MALSYTNRVPSSFKSRESDLRLSIVGKNDLHSSDPLMLKLKNRIQGSIRKSDVLRLS